MGEKLSAIEQEVTDLKKNGNDALKNAIKLLVEEIAENKSNTTTNDGNDKNDGQITELVEKVNKLEKDNEELKTEMAKLWAENRELREVKADKNALEKMAECIAEMNLAMQSQHLPPNNKWNLEEADDENVNFSKYFSYVDQSYDGLGVVKSGGRWDGGWNSVRAEKAVPNLKWNATKPYIAFYYEVTLLHLLYGKIHIGFCDKKFPLQGSYVGDNKRFSIGISNKTGMRVDGEFKHFGWHGRQFGAVIGVGLIHSPKQSSLKAFASSDGGFLAHFCKLELYPAVSLFHKYDKIEANFGKTEWAFNPYQLVQ